MFVIGTRTFQPTLSMSAFGVKRTLAIPKHDRSGQRHELSWKCLHVLWYCNVKSVDHRHVLRFGLRVGDGNRLASGAMTLIKTPAMTRAILSTVRI